MGKAFLLSASEKTPLKRTIQPEEIDGEVQRMHDALVATRREVMAVQQRVADAIGADEARIFEAHLLALEDQTLIDEALRILKGELVDAEYAFWAASDRFLVALEAVEDGFLRERAADMRDVVNRALRNLRGGADTTSELPNFDEPRVLVGRDIPPSIAASLESSSTLAMVTEVGGKTSHTAILARSSKTPAVVGVKGLTNEVKDGDPILVDGYNGLVILNPSDQTKFEYGQIVEKRSSIERMLEGVRDQPAETLDGRKIGLLANIERASNAEAALAAGAEGVGLFRTEYLFLNRSSFPSEEEQYQEYKHAVERLAPREVVIRTLDLGGDKLLSVMGPEAEMNPFLGWRAIRFCLQRPDVFRAQLRAILRASVHGSVRLMYPMITAMDELLEANTVLDSCKEELRASGIAFDDSLEAGVMIETPSAAVLADSLAQRAEFFSVGTNDLIQYALAVDRLNEKISHLYEPTNPAILRLIRMAVKAAHGQGKEVTVCGEMAGEPIHIPLLIGLEVDHLSVAPSLLGQSRFVIRNLRWEDARNLANDALKASRGQEVLRAAETFTRSIASELFQNER